MNAIDDSTRPRPVLFAVDSLRAIELGDAGIPALQAFFEDNAGIPIIIVSSIGSPAIW